MKALLYDGTLKLVKDYPDPAPPPGEALVRVSLAGICNTDLEITRGYMGFRGVLGHEFVGVVEACEVANARRGLGTFNSSASCPASVREDDFLVGRRVVGEINAACGQCSTCRAGVPTHCPHRTVLGIWRRDGAFADYLTLPTANLHPVPDGITDEEAVFIEPLAAALEILEQVHVHPTDRVVVLGDGKLGLLVAQVLALTGCDLMAVGHHPEKLAILQRRGIDARLSDEALDIKADVVVDCTGHPSGFAAARALIKPRGAIVVKSTFHGALELDLSALVVDEVTVIGSRCGPFPPALRLLEKGLVDVRSLVSAIYPLVDGLTAFQRAGERGTLKVLLRMGSTDRTDSVQQGRLPRRCYFSDRR